MPMKILALVPEASTARRCLDFALAAAQVADADIEAFHVRVDPESLIAAPEEIAFQGLREHDEGTALQRAEAVRDVYRDWLGATPETWRARISWRDVAGAEEASVVRETKGADIAVIAQPHNLDGGDAFHAAIRSSHRPALVIPDAAPSTPRLAARIAIAWNPTPQAHRAVEGAAVWLRQAQEVIAVMVAATLEAAGWDALQRLARQLGFEVTPDLVAPAGGEVGVQLTDAIRRLRIDATVLGAYRHGDVIEWALPSTTRYVLGHADVPLFLAH